MLVHCYHCKKNIVEKTKGNDWLYLSNLISILGTEESITPATYADAMNSLQSFKGYAFGWEDEQDRPSEAD